MSLNEDIACNLCGAHDAALLFPSTLTNTTPNASDFRCTSAAYGVHPPIVRCRRCNLVYANPRWDSSLVEESYSVVEDPTYVEEREGRVLTFSRNLKPLEDLVGATTNSRHLLDVGCHIGVMVELAQQRGWDAWGVEPSTWASEQARARGLHVITGTLNDTQIPENYFDVVTMWDVIEHLTDPAAELRNVHRVVKPGGIFAIHTIDIESAFARVMGGRWPWLMEMHLYYFSPRTLGKMLEQCGFQVIRSSAQGRFLRLGYFITRIQPYSKLLYRLLNSLVTRMSWGGVAIPVNFGDLFTLYARKV
ncbi:putative S-adenosylmethionine-dependent methyltransferase/MSMEI_2290 [Anaerolineae bacterium]|nr:putative S-adenosylmethionine-dependent methyltransferase/MSMEI_2290 [Anaerolineae bacterium]